MIENALDVLITRDEQAHRQHLVESGWLVSIPLTTVPSHSLYRGDYRLDGGYYTAESIAALRVLDDSGFEVKLLGSITEDIFVLDRFRRVYATNKKSGWPYLSASEALDFRPSSDRYIAKDHAPKLADNHFAKPNWILVSASGTVGRMVVTTPRLSKYFLTHDLIRIVPKESRRSGYLYAYLSSRIGQILISKDQYGSAIKHLEPYHLAGLPVPLLPEKEQDEINDAIIRAFDLRDEANQLLDEADNLLHEELGLPHFEESLVPYLPPPKTAIAKYPDMPHPRAFDLKASSLAGRLDASFHVPISRKAIEIIKNGKYPSTQLGKATADIMVAPRFKRIYVPKEYGTPFLQGSHLPQLRPYGLKYLSLTNQKELERWIVRKGWVLVTCSGTIGRIGYVSSYQDKWAASQHILRIIPDYNQGHPGYLAAFLMTPYGQHQLISKVYGGVIDEITEADTSAVWIPNAPKEIQAEIGERVVKAFEKKDEASTIEETAINNLENALQGK